MDLHVIFGGRHLYSLVLTDTKRVDRGFILYRDRRCIVVGYVEHKRQRIPIPLLSYAEKIVCSSLDEERRTPWETSRFLDNIEAFV